VLVPDKSPTFQMIIPLMMEVEMISETLSFYPQLTQLVA
jgi:hypothetical protein